MVLPVGGHYDNNSNNHIERRNSHFYNLLTAPCTVSNAYAQVAMAQSCANRALITCSMSCVTWYKGTAQLLSLTELKSHQF